MSERSYAPRPGGRAADANGAGTRRSGTRREQAPGTPDGGREALGRGALGREGLGREGSGRDALGRSAGREASHRGGDTREPGTAAKRADRAGRDGAVRDRAARERSARDRAARERSRAARRGAELSGSAPGLGVDAPVDGTAALQTDPVTAEPVNLIDLDRAPRLRVAPPAPISVPRAPFAAGVIGVVIAGVLGILMINTKTNENSFRIADLQKQSAALDNQQQDLDNQLAIVSSPGSLDAAARRLGLVKATPAQIRLPDGKVIGVLTPADGKPAVTARGAATGAATDEDKGAANIVPDKGTATQPGLTPTGAGPSAGTGTGAATGTGTGQ